MFVVLGCFNHFALHLFSLKQSLAFLVGEEDGADLIEALYGYYRLVTGQFLPVHYQNNYDDNGDNFSANNRFALYESMCDHHFFLLPTQSIK